MKNIFVDCRMRKILFVAVCIRSSLGGDYCYSSETNRNWQEHGTMVNNEWTSYGALQDKSIQVTGTVTDEFGPVIGATVQVKGSTTDRKSVV